MLSKNNFEVKKTFCVYFFKYIILFIIEISLYNSNILNNIFIFNSTHYRAGSFAFNSNGDMIIEYSYNNSRLFYGLKKKWKRFF